MAWKCREKYIDLILCFSMRVEWLSLASGAGVGHYEHDLPREECTIWSVRPVGRLCHAGPARVGWHRKGVFCQERSESTVEIHALGWHVLCLRPVILDNFSTVTSQVSWLWIEPLLIYVYAEDNYSTAKAKVVLFLITFLCVLWVRLSLYNNKQQCQVLLWKYCFHLWLWIHTDSIYRLSDSNLVLV